MKKFKIRKKEYVVIGKDELEKLFWNIGWRINAGILASDIADGLIDREAEHIEREYIQAKLKECRDILEKFEESL